MIHDGDADLLMRGMTKTRGFLSAISDKDGLMKNNFLSYVSLFELKDRLMLLTDTYINDFPDLSRKIAIAENSIELAETFGIKKRRLPPYHR
jgi:Phosphotransacetylase